MRLSEAIQELTAILNEEGDLDVMVATDDEGNHFRNFHGAQADWYYEGEAIAEVDLDEEYPREECEQRVTLW